MPVKREPKNTIDPMTGQPSGGRFTSDGPKPMGSLPQIEGNGSRWDDSSIVGHALSCIEARLKETDAASHLECIPTDIGWLVHGTVQVKTHCDDCGDELNHEQIQRMIGGDEHIIICGNCDKSTDAISVRNMVVSDNDNIEWFTTNFTDALLNDISLGKTAREQNIQDRLSVASPDYAVLASVGGEVLIDDNEAEPSRNRQGRAGRAQDVGASD